MQDGPDEAAIRRTSQLEELRLDISEVDTYAREVDAVFGGSWLLTDADPVRLVLAVTDDPEPHRAALTSRLEHADRFDVVRVRYPHAELRDTQRVIEADGVAEVAIDAPTNSVVVTMQKSDAVYVDELRLRFDDRVRVELALTDSPAARPAERRDAPGR